MPCSPLAPGVTCSPASDGRELFLAEGHEPLGWRAKGNNWFSAVGSLRLARSGNDVRSSPVALTQRVWEKGK